MNELIINTDGGSRGNPGPSAIAFVIKDNLNETIYEHAMFIGVGTNNEAEYTAMIYCLDWLIPFMRDEKRRYEKVTFFLDSLLVVNQLNGVFKIKEKRLQDFSSKIRNSIAELKDISPTLKQVLLKHVPRSQNHRADLLLNSELDKQN